MEFANFFVGNNEITKQFKGCYMVNDSSQSSSAVTSPLLSMDACLENQAQSGASVFSITNMNENGLAQCSSGLPKGKLMENVDEEQCLKDQKANTVYDVIMPSGALKTLGKTFLGVKKEKASKMVFHEFPSTLLKMGTEYSQLNGYDSSDNNLANSEISNASSDQCKQFCINRGQECKGFVYDKANNRCELKSQIYPMSKRQINKSKDIYTRMPDVEASQSCPSGIKAVNTDFINKNGFLSSEKITQNFQCDANPSITEESNTLDVAYKTLTEEVSGLRKENESLMKSFEETRQRIKEKTSEYHATEAKVNDLKESPTVNRMLLDSSQLGTMFSMRNTGYILALVLLSILLIRVLRK